MAFLRDEQKRLIRKDGSLVEGAQQGRAKGPRRVELGRGRVSHLKVDKILGGAGPLREEYESLLENPNTLLKDLQAWFAARGLYVNKTAIGRHRHRHLARYEQVRDAAETAAAFCELTRRYADDGRGTFVEAAQGHIEMLTMNRMREMKSLQGVAADDWRDMCRTIRELAAGRRQVEEVRDGQARRAKEAAARAQVGKKPDYTEVIKRMKEILG